MPEMISATFAEKIIMREMGVNRVNNVELQKMVLDHKSVKATIKAGAAKVEFILQEEKPAFKVTGENIPGDLYLQFLDNMNSMVDEIFNPDGEGLYDFDRRTGDSEVKEKYTVEAPQEDVDPQTGEEQPEENPIQEETVIDADISAFEMSEEEIVSEVVDVVGEGNVVVQESLKAENIVEYVEETKDTEDIPQWSLNPDFE